MGSHVNEYADARPSNDAWRQAARRWSPLNFGGRIGRTEFVVYLLVWHALMGFGVALVSVVVVAPVIAFAEGGALANAAVLGFAAFAAVVYGLGVASFGVRRLHDLGRSGPWILLALLPLVNLALGAALLVVPGTAGENVHGARGPTPAVVLAPASIAGARVASEDEAAAFAAGRLPGGAGLALFLAPSAGVGGWLDHQPWWRRPDRGQRQASASTDSTHPNASRASICMVAE
jgi:uncharacterized membrane protein YhaH (DUF805 family)